MPQIQSPFLGGFYESRSLLLAAQRSVNLYAEMVDTRDGKEPGALYGTPGLTWLATIGNGGWRGLRTVRGQLFGVSGGRFYQITGGFVGIDRGGIGTNSGPVSMVDSGLQLLITDGERAYGYDVGLNSFREIVLPFVAGAPVICAYQDGIFLINQSGTQNWWQSSFTDGATDVFTWNALAFSTKDGQPDPIVAIVDNHREAWLLGSQTTEVWINAGLTPFAFQRLQGVFLQEGCAAPHSAVTAGTSVMWLSRSREGQGIVYQSVGYQAKRVSTHAIEREIQSYTRIDDAIGFAEQTEGHLFYWLIFPSANATWVFDLSTGLWHQRAFFFNGDLYRHRANCFAFFNGYSIVGDWETGALYALDLNEYTDAGMKIKRIRSWQAFPTGRLSLKRVRMDKLQLYAQPTGAWEEPIRTLRETGDWRQLQTTDYLRKVSGVTDDDFSDPIAVLRISKTGGLSWGNEHFSHMGREGEVEHRTFWLRLGQAKDPVFEVSTTAKVKIAWLAAMLEAQEGVS